MERKKNNSIMARKIDTGGLSQFYTGYQEQSPVMLLDYTLKKAVNPVKLHAAVIMALDVFPFFRVRLALNERRQPVYEWNTHLPCIYEDDGKLQYLLPANRSVFPRLAELDPVFLYLFGILESGENGVLRYGMRYYEDFNDQKDLLLQFLWTRAGWKPW